MTFIEPFLLILGRKFSLSLLNVISKLFKNMFIPSKRDVGLRQNGEKERVIDTQLKERKKLTGRKKRGCTSEMERELCNE